MMVEGSADWKAQTLAMRVACDGPGAPYRRTERGEFCRGGGGGGGGGTDGGEVQARADSCSRCRGLWPDRAFVAEREGGCFDDGESKTWRRRRRGADGWW